MDAIVKAIFERLAPVAEVAKSSDLLSAQRTRFKPRHDLWAKEGSREKWLQCISEYYFAEAVLEDVYVPSDPSVHFTFYLDPIEPLNSEAGRNVNPEVVCCTFLEKAVFLFLFQRLL